MPASPPRSTVGSVMNKLIERVNSDMRRLRILEQESSLVKTRQSSTEEDVLSLKNQLATSLHEAGEKVAALEERLASVEATLKEVISQLKKTTTISKIKELEQMIDLYNPLKSQFITREEAERLIEERLRE